MERGSVERIRVCGCVSRTSSRDLRSDQLVNEAVSTRKAGIPIRCPFRQKGFDRIWEIR